MAEFQPGPAYHNGGTHQHGRQLGSDEKGDLEQLPVLNLRALTPAQLRAMAALFDELRDEEFERLPAMADCPARRRLDEGLAAILSLPDLSGLRRLLATEPVVSNRRL